MYAIRSYYGGNTRLDASLRKAQRLTLRMPLLIAAHQRLRQGLEPIQPVPGRDIAYNFLYTLQGKAPDQLLEKAFDVALILHADHELNASTFAASRITSYNVCYTKLLRTEAEEVLSAIEQEVSKTLLLGKIPVVLGGEHTVTCGVIAALKKRYDSFGVIQFDAHADLRNEYEGFV